MVQVHQSPLLPRQKSFFPPQIPNPFVHEINFTPTKQLQMLLCGFLLLPIRILLFISVIFLTWSIAIVSAYGSDEKNLQPITGRRRNITKYLIGFLGRILYLCMGFRIHIKGIPASSVEAPILVAAPHSSFFDGIAVIASGMPSIVSRVENAEVPIFGRILQVFQPILVSRVDPDSRMSTIGEIRKRVTSEGEWPQVLLFPEGTCTNRSCLISFKTGAFLPGVPVQPIVLRYPNKLDTVTWTWQGYSVVKLLLMTLCQFYTNVEVEFLPVYVPSNDEKQDPFLFANKVRQHMAQVAGLPVTEHTYEDCRLMLTARELTLPMEAGLVEFTKISKKLNLKWHKIKEQLEVFATVAELSKGGRIGIEEFASHLKLPVSDILRELFALFDRNNDGSIDFREYVIGISVLCNPANTEETIQMAFKLFDVDEDGSITENEFTSLLQSSLGVPNLNVTKLFREIDTDQSGKISNDEFKKFFLKNPEYAKLFTTYIEHQRYYHYMLQEDDKDMCFEDYKGDRFYPKSTEDQHSDKKED
uniref:Lysophosphatidylcholine acyltransferase 2 n=1 Tax=Leptobrachium leishanense TaxID=445787 RepID=A0A8C5WFL9_9ANUR